MRYFGYAWSFATIWPAIFETGDWSRACATGARRRDAPSAGSGIALVRRMAVAWWPARRCCSSRALYPSQYLAAPVFLGSLLLDPLNASAGAESILGMRAKGATAG